VDRGARWREREVSKRVRSPKARKEDNNIGCRGHETRRDYSWTKLKKLLKRADYDITKE
jgi:hypothetical protein